MKVPTPSTAGSGAAITLAQAVSVTTLGVLPTFLVGALAVQIQHDLAIGPRGVGLAAAIFFTVAGLLARPFGRIVQCVGSGRGMIATALLAAASLAGLGLASSVAVLVVALVVGGAANATGQPAANLSISRAVGSARLGLAFGIKQTSVPAATLLGGLAVPGVALALGWRWAFGISAAVALAVAVWILLRPPDARVQVINNDVDDTGTPRGGLLVLTIGAGLASASGTSLGIFLVDSSVRAGLTPGTAGLLFAVAAVLGLLTRIGLGAAIDRQPGRDPYLLIANLMTGGAAGFLMLGLGSTPLFVAGALISYGAGWTWPGVIHFAIVRDNRLEVAAATGLIQTGLSLGAAAGPLSFGLLVEATSYETAWLATAGLSLVAAGTIRAGRRMVRRATQSPHLAA